MHRDGSLRASLAPGVAKHIIQNIGSGLPYDMFSSSEPEDIESGNR